MKRPMPLFLFLLPAIASAQGYPGMDEAQMQNMMQQMQKMQQCMQNIDQSELQALEQRSKQMEAEVNALCSNGQRDEAQEKAISFAREVADTPAIAQMRKCGELMEGVMAQMPYAIPEEDYTESHVCDH